MESETATATKYGKSRNEMLRDCYTKTSGTLVLTPRPQTGPRASFWSWLGKLKKCNN